jgi:hypothetical protein
MFNSLVVIVQRPTPKKCPFARCSRDEAKIFAGWKKNKIDQFGSNSFLLLSLFVG